MNSTSIENCINYMTFCMQFSIRITAKNCNLNNAVIHNSVYSPEEDSYFLSEILKKQLNKNPPHQDKSLKHGDTILFFGEELILNIESSTSPGRPRTEIESGVLRLSVPSHFSEEVRSQAVRKALTGLLREKGIEHITGRVNHFSQIVNVSYSKITLKNVSSLWGSCSARNNLNFNQHLLMAPPEVIDYVVVHEVSHLVHRDHSSRFWALVRSLDPDYKLHRLWLRKNQKKLSL